MDHGLSAGTPYPSLAAAFMSPAAFSPCDNGLQTSKESALRVGFLDTYRGVFMPIKTPEELFVHDLSDT